MNNITIRDSVRQQYDRACTLCGERYKMIHGQSHGKCEYRENGGYCPEILKVEEQRRMKQPLSEHMEKYLGFFNAGDSSSGYTYMKRHGMKFEKAELVAIILAFDAMIYPARLGGVLDVDFAANVAYLLLDEFVRKELVNSSEL